MTRAPRQAAAAVAAAAVVRFNSATLVATQDVVVRSAVFCFQVKQVKASSSELLSNARSRT